MKRWSLAALLYLLALPIGAQVFTHQAAYYSNIYALDTFPYSNGVLAGNTNWVTEPSLVSLNVVSNQLECASIGSTDCGNLYSVASPAFPNDQCAQSTILTLNAVDTATMEIKVRVSLSTNTYYAVFIKGPLGSSAQVLVGKVISGTFTSLVAFTAETMNSGDIVTFCARGTNLYTSIRGTIVPALSTTDSSITSGVPGIGIQSDGQAETDVILGKWAGFYLGTTVPTGVVGTPTKWHPGQYFNYPVAPSQAPINPSNQSGLWTSYGPDMRGSINPATSKPGFRGIENDYSWFYLDMCAPSGSGGCNVGPTDGTAGGGTLAPGVSSTQYNTKLIDNDLATLAAASAADGVIYRLGILVMSEYWQAPGTLPAVPQGAPYGAANNSSSIAPDYIITGVGGFGTDLIRTNNTATIALWRPATMTAYINLLNYLGAKYDGNPLVEFIVPIPETGLTWNSSGGGSEPSDYSVSAFQTQYLNMVSAMRTSWPTTNKAFNDNWGIQGEALSSMAARDATVATNNGWGFGGPDVIYLTPYGATTPYCTSISTTLCETSGEGIVRGEGGSYGTNVFKGAVPLIYQVQANAYSWTNQTSAGTESYGYTDLGITHFIWIDTQTNGNSTQSLSGIRTALGAVSYRINSACPTNYTHGCNTSFNMPADNDDHFHKALDGRLLEAA